MTLSKIILIFLILSAIAHCCFGQSRLKAELYDHFGELPCGHRLNRIDTFIQDLNAEPGSTGLILIYSNERSLDKARQYKHDIDGTIYSRGFDKDRIAVETVKREGVIGVDVWKIPAGVKEPVITEEKWPDAAPDLTRPFVFGSEFPELYCTVFMLPDYARLLIENPDLRGHIVIYNNLKKMGAKKLKNGLKNSLRITKSHVTG